MNPAYWPLVLFILSSIIQGIIYVMAMQRRKGYEEAQIEKIQEQKICIENLERDLGNMKAAHTILSTQVANIRGWLRGTYGGDINGGS